MDAETGLYYSRFRYFDSEDGRYVSQDPIGLESGEFSLFTYSNDPNSRLDLFGLAGSGGAYMYTFESGRSYIGKGEEGRMNGSIKTRSSQDVVLGGNGKVVAATPISTGGDNTLGKMVEYKAMKDAGSEGKEVPAKYLNSFTSGKSDWDKNPQLQKKASKLAKKLKKNHDEDLA